MDSYDKKILDRIQSGFPLAPRPYQVLGDEIGMTEAEVLARVRALRGRGIIRRIGANFQSKKLGFRSTLCAAHVPQEKLESFVDTVNAYVGVTHNYQRDHYYNVWFTFIGPSWDAVCDTLAEISAKTGIEVLNMPAERLYKIKVEFKMEDDEE
ncbi:siroheme decarboxylase subunit alpha [Oceanidesulfovibrio marinus]|uniref:siroheme decarboxylase n=1 Tax=Oceanidesulfovibrio marinus TaxID=370038 RepID=A0A6P1ZLL4_9BACT|nr:siroheme decarboxylase subunit alpha [Oceanidesulfovibrio marinus]QJT09180.1 AsnC family transcriptional regulator [Oceanidesulfovibrio marinus]TVM36390.1 Lrp/AsnC family transcriptional regulator [Oceanidesulfovibrio marinus]